MSELTIEKIKERRDRYQVTFSSDAGKAVLNDLLKEARLFLPAFDERRPDPMLAAYRDGKKAMVIYILEILGYRVEDYPQFQMEAINREREHQRRI